jgi:iron-sulfur cluster assembly protein
MAIELTERAAERAKGFLGADPSALGLRFGVKRTGCSGWAYVIDVAHDALASDEVFASRGVKVYVDPKSLPMIDGTEIDFARKGLNAEFTFRNPNVSAECGCGESFTTDERFG